MLPAFGAAFQLAALVLAVLAAVVGFANTRRDDPARARVARRAFYASSLMVVGASIVLVAAFVGNDFQLAYVTENSARGLALGLKVAGFYGGQDGSLLYWTLALTLIGSLSVAAAARRLPALATLAAAFLASTTAFFLFVLVFVASPFSVLATVPRDGLGLNPVLRDGGMMIHPPFQLAGYSSFAIPFAFAMAALLARRYDAAWIAVTRRVALVSWGLQSAGVLLGMWWSYHVLGWGGYFSWDPVENVAIMPWLAVTAYLHSIQVQQRHNRLRAWNFGLVILAFLLSVFGTFIVRSGIVPSVHTFAISPIGPWFFGFLAIAVVVSGVMLASASGSLKSARPMEGLVSREGSFLLQNIVIVLLIGAILWGVLLPVLTGSLGRQMVVAAPYYNQTSAPLMALLLALLATGPLLPWRRVLRPVAGARTRVGLSLNGWLRRLAWPAAAFLLGLAVLLVGGVRQLGPLLALPLVVAGLATCTLEYARGGRQALRSAGSARRLPGAVVRIATRNRRRYGAYLAHVGILAIAAGIAGSHFWQQEQQVQLRPGQQVSVAWYRLTYQGTYQVPEGDHLTTFARFREDDGTVLTPARLVYPAMGGAVVSHVVIESSPVADLYLVLNGTTAAHGAAVTVFVNPLVPWIWVGGFLLVLGVLLGNLGHINAVPASEPRRAFRPQVARTSPSP
ncbi:MAG: cytochrome c-type biogenesis CcmF C-terminal domain-containing protein [Candidatus Dormiibacterota bacterium]